MAAATFLAIDLGAESGRALLARLTDRKLHLEEIHRFPNGAVPVFGSLHWDALRLWQEIRTALGQAAQHCDKGPDAIGIDTWGVDFGLIGQDGGLLGNPHHYRDTRTEGMMEEAFELMPAEEIFEHTGVQFMRLNTIFQLLAMARGQSRLLEAADTLLI